MRKTRQKCMMKMPCAYWMKRRETAESPLPVNDRRKGHAAYHVRPDVTDSPIRQIRRQSSMAPPARQCASISSHAHPTIREPVSLAPRPTIRERAFRALRQINTRARVSGSPSGQCASLYLWLPVRSMREHFITRSSDDTRTRVSSSPSD